MERIAELAACTSPQELLAHLAGLVSPLSPAMKLQLTCDPNREPYTLFCMVDVEENADQVAKRLHAPKMGERLVARLIEASPSFRCPKWHDGIPASFCIDCRLELP